MKKEDSYLLLSLFMKVFYKGISAKLRDTVNSLIRQKRVFYVLDENNKKKLKAN